MPLGEKDRGWQGADPGRRYDSEKAGGTDGTPPGYLEGKTGRAGGTTGNPAMGTS